MSQLVSASDVKKAYRKACLTVHPDKVNNLVKKNLFYPIYLLKIYLP